MRKLIRIRSTEAKNLHDRDPDWRTNLKVPLQFERGFESFEGKRLHAEREFWLVDFGEHASGFVDSELAHVDVFFATRDRPTAREGLHVQDPALTDQETNGDHLVQGNPHHFVDVELASRFVERLVRPEIVMTERHPLSTARDPVYVYA